MFVRPATGRAGYREWALARGLNVASPTEARPYLRLVAVNPRDIENAPVLFGGGVNYN